MRAKSMLWALTLGAVTLCATLAVAAETTKPATYVCQGSSERYELQVGEINEGSVSLRVCASKASLCGTQISLDEDTDQESTSRRFFGLGQDGREYFLEFWEVQDKGRAEEYWLTVELDGVVLDHQMTCRLK